MSIRAIALLAALPSLISTPAEAQRRPSSPPPRVELSGGYAYQWGGNSQSPDGDFKVPSSNSFGFTLGFPVRPGGRVELLYWRQDTRAEFNPVGGGAGTEGLFDIAVEYWQLGGMSELPRGFLTPFFVLTLGATRLVPKGNASGDEFRFSGTVGGGIKIAGEGRVGVRLEARALITASNTESAFFCGTGKCGVGVAGDAIMQGLLSASLFVKLGDSR